MNSGLFLIDKPEGLTSFQVVRRVRRALGVKKVGHMGTLDPFATGLLILGVGEAAKLAPFILEEPKTYRAAALLGVATATQDLTGEVVSRTEELPDEAAVRRVMAGLVGELEQVPPAFSAVHHKGRRAYHWARKGQAVELAPRRVNIYEIEVEEVALPLVTFTVKCSTGTYIRTLAADLGAALGCGGHLTALRRLEVGPFKLEEALTLEALEKFPREELLARLISPDRALAGMPPVPVDAAQARKLREGRPLPLNGAALEAGERVKVVSSGELVAVATVSHIAGQAILTPVRVFFRWS